MPMFCWLFTPFAPKGGREQRVQFQRVLALLEGLKKKQPGECLFVLPSVSLAKVVPMVMMTSLRLHHHPDTNMGVEQDCAIFCTKSKIP